MRVSYKKLYEEEKAKAVASTEAYEAELKGLRNSLSRSDDSMRTIRGELRKIREQQKQDELHKQMQDVGNAMLRKRRGLPPMPPSEESEVIKIIGVGSAEIHVQLVGEASVRNTVKATLSDDPFHLRFKGQ